MSATVQIVITKHLVDPSGDVCFKVAFMSKKEVTHVAHASTEEAILTLLRAALSDLAVA